MNLSAMSTHVSVVMAAIPTSNVARAKLTAATEATSTAAVRARAFKSLNMSIHLHFKPVSSGFSFDFINWNIESRYSGR